MLDAKEIAVRAARCLDSKKAIDICALNVQDISSITSSFVIATGQVDRHVRALAEYLIEEFKLAGMKVFHVDGLDESCWIVLDYGQLIVHIFNPAMRVYYKLEKLWGDAEEIHWDHE